MVTLLSTDVLTIDAAEAARVICDWATQPIGRAVCAANVHMLMEAHDDPDFAGTLRDADLVVCDGRPLVWAARLLGDASPSHCRGLDLTLEVCRAAAAQGLSVGLYGGEPWVLDEVGRRLGQQFPTLDIVFAWSPPFRELTPEEDIMDVGRIVADAPRILLVSLGCPKQERWMLAHRDRLPSS